MTTALQTAYLSWDLASPAAYQAGEELECTVDFTASEEGTYYLIGALYTTNLEYISGTLFGVLVPEGSTYAVNSLGYTSLWELEADEVVELPCKFILDRSDVILGLFLLRMIGDNPTLGEDEEIASLTVQLSSPAPTLAVESLIPMVMIFGLFGFMMHETLKD